MRSSFAILCVYICFNVDASTPNGCSKIPEVDNAEVSQNSRKDNYTIGDKLDYVCKLGYATLQKISYKCVDNNWSKLRGVNCSLKRCELPEDIPNGRYIIESGGSFVFGTTIKYICKDGYQMMSRTDTRTCRNGGWDKQLPACEEVLCVLDNIEKNITVKGLPDNDDNELIRPGHRLTFSCHNGLILEGPEQITCRSSGQWSSPYPKCVEATCPLNTTVEDLSVVSFPKIDGPVKPGQKLLFLCKERGMKLKGLNEITCQSNGAWSSPFPKCEEVMCVANLTANMRSFGHQWPVVSVRPGETVTLVCVGKGSQLKGPSIITCKPNGEWNVPFPECVGGKCGPPPNVEFADTVDMLQPEYNSGVKVEYRCFNKYTLVERDSYSKYMTCEQGQWRGNVKCLKPCTVTVEEMDERGIQLRWGGRQKIFSPHEDRITFICQWPKKPLNVNELKQTCNDGVMTLPECV